MKFYLISLGCQMNISDSERLVTALSHMGMEKTDNENEAHVLGIMACSVRQRAIDKVYSIIYKWNQRKLNEAVFTFISGCILPSDREKFLKQFDLLFSINELSQLPTMLQALIPSALNLMSEQIHEPSEIKQDIQSIKKIQPLTYNKQTFIPSNTHKQTPIQTNDITKDFWQYQPTYSSHFSAFVSIQNGCDKFCTFCAVPYTRGREVSRSSADILKEVYTLMQKGYKSITLLGQNVNSYGLNTEHTELNFAQLLERIGNMAKELNHRCWIYFTSPHPKDMGRDVLKVIAKYACLAKQIHLPLQSGDDKLLIKMNRNHSVKKYKDTITDIKQILPHATLFTDVIVGFCGETHEQFNNTKKIMQEYSFAMAYIAIYSPRPGAASSRWEDSVSLEEKKQRFRELTKILQDNSQKSFEKYRGKTLPVLIEGRAKNTKKNSKRAVLRANTEGKIPVYINASHIDEHKIKDVLIGNFVDVKITNIRALSMEGLLL